MKRLKLVIIVTLLALIPYSVKAQKAPLPQDSVEISLLTCTPGQQIWAQFGHTAIRVHDLRTGDDIAVNYGMFSSDQPYFVMRFIFGLTDYKMDVEPFNVFVSEYAYEGRGIIEQKLDISGMDKARILAALQKNILPENQVYRYNFFYDNCTTRARDIIVNNLGSSVQYSAAKQDSCSFRYYVHRANKDYPWIRFGEDLLLGLPADYKTNKSEQQFLPDNLRADFEKTLYNGKPLVSSSRVILQPVEQAESKTSTPTPLDVIIILCIVTVIIEYIEYKKGVIFWGLDLFYMLLTGLPGIIIFAMLFSQHPTVSLNLLILFLNPIPLLFAYPAVMRTRRHRKFFWWTLWEILIVLGMIGGFFQTYPSGMLLLALLLLTRPLMHHYRQREISRKK